MPTNLQIDGDILLYRIGFSCQKQEEGEIIAEPSYVAQGRMDALLESIFSRLLPEKSTIWLSGDSNFRYAVYPEYKATRADKKKPVHYDYLKNYLVHKIGAEVADGIEADDAIAMSMQEDTICVSIDKDMYQLSGLHYNFVKDELFFQDELSAKLSFWGQMLTGDTIDNIKGIKGIGPVKAYRALELCTTELEMRAVVEEMYKKEFGSVWEEKFIVNGTCLWLLREPNQDWATDILKYIK